MMPIPDFNQKAWEEQGCNPDGGWYIYKDAKLSDLPGIQKKIKSLIKKFFSMECQGCKQYRANVTAHLQDKTLSAQTKADFKKKLKLKDIGGHHPNCPSLYVRNWWYGMELDNEDLMEKAASLIASDSSMAINAQIRNNIMDTYCIFTDESRSRPFLIWYDDVEHQTVVPKHADGKIPEWDVETTESTGNGLALVQFSWWCWA